MKKLNSRSRRNVNLRNSLGIDNWEKRLELLKNPFYILQATPLDSRHRIIELSDERSLFIDANECMKARSILTHPQNRIAAEVAWMPDVDSERTVDILKSLETLTQNPNINNLLPITQANVLAAGLSCMPNPTAQNVKEWILKIAWAFQSINSNSVRTTLNEERRKSGFTEIPDLLAIETEIRNQGLYYQKVIRSALEKLSDKERAYVLTSVIELTTSKGTDRSPILIENLIPFYEQTVQESLGKKQKIIESLDKKIRAMADAQDSDTTLKPVVNQLIQVVKDWDMIAQPIQLNKKSTGERHDASFEVAFHVRELAIHLLNEYEKVDFSSQIIKMLLEVYAEVPEIVERLNEDSKALNSFSSLAEDIEKALNIKRQVDKIKKTADAKSLDSVLASKVNQLIQTLKDWDPTTQIFEANNTVALTVRGITLHLWNEHQKVDFSLQITKTLIGMFGDIPEIAKLLTEDLAVLEKHAIAMEGIEKLKNITELVNKLKTTVDTGLPPTNLSPIVNQLIQKVKDWNTTTQTSEANEAVAYTVRGIALHLWNEHQQLAYARQITNALLEVFRESGIYSRIAEDKRTLERIGVQHRIRDLQSKSSISQERRNQETGCLLFLVGIISVIPAGILGILAVLF